MQKFQIGDTVKIIDNRGYSDIPVETIGTILTFHGHKCSFPYVLVEFPSLGFGESELELVTTPSTAMNPDLDKRVSETRDTLLRDIFGI